MAKTKTELVTFMQARRTIAQAYSGTIINKIYEEYVNRIERLILKDDLQPISINKFDIQNLIEQLSSDDKIDILKNIGTSLASPEHNDSDAVQGEVIALLIADILKSESNDCDYIVHKPEPITIYKFNYNNVLDQLVQLFKDNGYEPEIDTNYGPKKVIIKIV